MTVSSLEISGLRKSFGGVEALRGANLSCSGGETHALIGENGAGKSTLVKVLSGAVTIRQRRDLARTASHFRSPLRVRRARPASQPPSKSSA